ncbi:MAG: hypothetical protein MMC33_005749 [Icmadophila ericetorum]|nr:hypothetical protein [Icmadophila ericetorum]
MAAPASRVPTLRHILSPRQRPLCELQRRWAQVHDLRFLATHHQELDRAVLEKYKEKLDRKVREKGLRDVNELKEVYKDKIQTLKKQASISATPAPPPSPQAFSSSLYPQPPPPPLPPRIPPVTASKSPPGIKTLSSFLDLKKTLTLPPKEIEHVWRLRHASNPLSLCATIPFPIYQRLEVTARKYPQFILPLPRTISDSPDPDQANDEATASVAVEIHFLQHTFPSPETHTVLFTHLAEYKLRGEYATPHTTVTHHLELAESKGLVLCQGQVLEGRGLGVDEGRLLVMQMQRFYGAVGGATGTGSPERRELLEQFSSGDSGFSLEKLVEEAEKVV